MLLLDNRVLEAVPYGLRRLLRVASRDAPRHGAAGYLSRSCAIAASHLTRRSMADPVIVLKSAAPRGRDPFRLGGTQPPMIEHRATEARL